MSGFSFKDAKILIVDDQKANIDILTGLLKFQGYKNYFSTTDPRNVLDLYFSYFTIFL